MFSSLTSAKSKLNVSESSSKSLSIPAPVRNWDTVFNVRLSLMLPGKSCNEVYPYIAIFLYIVDFASCESALGLKNSFNAYLASIALNAIVSKSLIRAILSSFVTWLVLKLRLLISNE
ncbi:hypothetical protein FPHOBKDP_00185 [Listeria phage LPJP1]|nr:hypothetical protein FPHOBKDP_00185 [Listeria phage LPJP1]